MKSKPNAKKNWAARRRWAALLGMFAAVGSVSAADTNAPSTNAPAPPTPPLTPQQFFEGGEKSYDNWVDFSVGGYMANMNRAAAQRASQSSLGLLGGIDDFHYGKEIAATTWSNDHLPHRAN